jgi:hypothetical protein
MQYYPRWLRAHKPCWQAYAYKYRALTKRLAIVFSCCCVSMLLCIRAVVHPGRFAMVACWQVKEIRSYLTEAGSLAN